MKAMMRGVTKGLPQTGLQGGAGVAAFYIHRMLASKVAFFQNKPLAVPLLMIGLGHVLKKSKKLNTAGAALVGAGGYAGAQVFEVRKSMQQSAPAQTAGFEDDDTGALVSASDVGALMAPSDIGDLNESAASSYDDAYADAYTL